MRLIKQLIRLFNEHPEEIGLSYMEHVFRALSFSIVLAYASILCLIHAVFPFLFEYKASNIISLLNKKMGN